METRRHISGGLVLAVAALLCLAGCKKDEEGEKVVLGVDFEQTAGMQKTYIGNGDKTIYWSTNDQVKVNGTNYLVHDGVVEVNMCDDGYAAVYPATNTLTYSSETHSGKTCIGGEVVIPATQTYAADANGIQQLNGPMAARLDTKTGRLLFRNLYAVIKVTVKAKNASFTLNSITVESTNSMNLAGTQPFTFSAATNTAEALTLGTLSNGSTSVTLTGISTDISKGDSASFYLYTVPFSKADLTIWINGNKTDKTAHARNGIGISRSQLRSTTVELEIPIFSVAADRSVIFSPGNLQWSATGTHKVAGGGSVAGTWRFAEHQWDYIGDTAGNNTTSDRDKQSAWIDLFGWGTSGWSESGATEYQPYATSTTYSDYYPGNAYDNSLTGSYANADWGVYNAIYNPKTKSTDAAGTWRTLSNAEWQYLLGVSGNGRSNRHSDWWIYNMVKITDVGSAGVTGLIIYPDGVTTADLSGFTGKANFSQNSRTAAEITKAEFETLEAMGCVFLPAAGYRNGTSVSTTGIRGYYWSSTRGDSSNAYSLYFNSGYVSPSSNYTRSSGRSVRLVKDVK